MIFLLQFLCSNKTEKSIRKTFAAEEKNEMKIRWCNDLKQQMERNTAFDAVELIRKNVHSDRKQRLFTSKRGGGENGKLCRCINIHLSLFSLFFVFDNLWFHRFFHWFGSIRHISFCAVMRSAFGMENVFLENKRHLTRFVQINVRCLTCHWFHQAMRAIVIPLSKS